jgi:hypothetical protein
MFVDPSESDAKEGMPSPGRLHHLIVGDDMRNKGSAGERATFVRLSEGDVTGPPSSEAGVFSDFTSFIAFDGKAPATEASLMRVAGIRGSDLAHIELLLRPTPDDGVEVVARVGADEAVVQRPPGSGQYVYWMTRAGQTLDVGAVAQGGSVSGTVETGARVSPDVTAPMRLNADSAILGKFLFFGTYSGSLDDRERAALFAELRRRALLADPVVAQLAGELSEAVSQARSATKRNPYGTDAVQDACPSVTDWTRPNLADAGDACRATIATHCEANPKGTGCECWDKDAARYATPACVNHRLAFGKEAGTDLASLTAEQVADVKRKYGLVHAVPAPAPKVAAAPARVARRRRWYDFLT